MPLGSIFLQFRQSFNYEISARKQITGQSLMTTGQVAHGSNPLTDVSDQRIRALDGLRGIAILLVLFSHLTPDVALRVKAFEWVRKAAVAGWVGVDLFFVLSGYLITGILLRRKSRPDYFKTFYARRILRIFPLYFAMLIVVFLILPAIGILHSPGFEIMQRHQAWNWLFSTNLGMWVAGRSAFISDQIAVSHFWSLAVEEHFYLVWPVVVLALNRRALSIVCIGGVVVALLIRCMGVFVIHASPYFFVITPCRIDGLMVGAWLAARTDQGGLIPRRVARMICACCGVFLGLAFVSLRGLWPAHWLTESIGLTAISLLFGSVLVIAIGLPAVGFGGYFLNGGLLQLFGKYSYAIYVIHGLLGGAVFEGALSASNFIRWSGSTTNGVALCLLARIAVSALLGMLSWHLLEKHFLKLKRHFEYQAPTLPPERAEDAH
jgi:peptidoglycan/LPS O-acetylase OafA/YrhL